MELVYEILKSMWNTSLSYKGVRTNMFGIPQIKNKSDNTIRSTKSQMKNRVFIENYDQCWHITPGGREYMRMKINSLKKFPNIFKKDAPKNLMVMFDIPEKQKAEREWFRWHLKKLNYKMIQKSVWVGPSPLPKQFIIELFEMPAKPLSFCFLF